MVEYFYEPSFHLWSPENWHEFFDAGGAACFACGEVVDDPRYACAVETNRSWQTGSSSYVYAHVECLRRVHPALT